MRIDVRFDEADHRRVIARLNELIRDGEDMSPVMREVSEHLLSIAEESFDREGSPDGAPWEPLAPSTRRSRRRAGKDGPILQRDRHLRRSLDSAYDRTSAEAGTNLIYAATHQFGRPPAGIPARPFLGIGPGDADHILDIIGRHLVPEAP